MLKKLTVLASMLVVIMLTASFSSKPLRLVFPNKVNYEPFIIADKTGLFKQVGLNLEIIHVTGGIQAAEALSTGSADVAAMGESPAIILLSQKSPSGIVTRYGYGERIHKMLAINSIKQPQDLKGKRVGVQAGSSTHGGLFLWLTRMKLKADDISIIPLDPMNMPDAIKTGMIDAMAGSEPWPTRVMTYCPDKVHLLADFSGLGNTFPHVLMASDSYRSKHPEEIEKLVQALSKAVDFMNASPDKAAEINASSIKLTVEQQKKCTSAMTFKLGWTDEDLRSMNISAQFLKDFGKIREIPDNSQYPVVTKKQNGSLKNKKR